MCSKDNNQFKGQKMLAPWCKPVQRTKDASTMVEQAICSFYKVGSGHYSSTNMVQSWSLSDQISFSLNEQINFIVQAASINTKLK
jgi:hypothetical protein